MSSAENIQVLDRFHLPFYISFRDKIFQIFHSLKKSKESTGIGLSIVKKIVDNYDGRIWLESEPNKGTTFFFTLKKTQLSIDF